MVLTLEMNLENLSCHLPSNPVLQKHARRPLYSTALVTDTWGLAVSAQLGWSPTQTQKTEKKRDVCGKERHHTSHINARLFVLTLFCGKNSQVATASVNIQALFNTAHGAINHI